MNKQINRIAIMSDINMERERQEALKKAGKFQYGCGDSASRIVCLSSTAALGAAAKLAILSEEVGEAARHVCETLIDTRRYQPRELKKELIQVAAVAVAWIEDIDRELDDQAAFNRTTELDCGCQECVKRKTGEFGGNTAE